MDNLASASATPEPKRRGRTEGVSPQRRKGSDGNLLWQIYQDEIGEADRVRFRALLEEKQVPYVTFLAHTRKGRRLDQLSAKHLVLYRDFFYLVTDAKYDLNVELRKEEKALGPLPVRANHRHKKAETTA